MKKIVALFIGLTIIGLGCESTNFSEEIKTIDSLLVELDTIDLMQRRVDTTGFSQSSQTFTENITYVQRTFTDREDTMSKDIAVLMSDYRSLKKPSKGFLGKYQRTREEITFAKNQLADLRHDLQNNLLDSNLVDKMLEDEIKAVDDIKNSVENLQISSDFTRSKREELEPRIDSLIQVLKQDEP